MNNVNRFHALMSELHHLLSSYTPKDFREASERGGDMKPILLAISSVLTGSEPLNKIQEPSLKVTASLESSDTSALVADTPASIEELLRRSRKTATTADLWAISRMFGLNVALNSKDGRSRNLTKLAKAIAFAPAALRRNVIRELSIDQTSDTQGWFDVIRKRG